MIRIKYRVKEHPNEPLPVPLINELDRTMIYSLKEWKAKLAKEAEAKLEQERRALAEHEALIAGMKANLENEAKT